MRKSGRYIFSKRRGEISRLGTIARRETNNNINIFASFTISEPNLCIQNGQFFTGILCPMAL